MGGRRTGRGGDVGRRTGRGGDVGDGVREMGANRPNSPHEVSWDGCMPLFKKLAIGRNQNRRKKMAKIRSFKELRVWQNAIETAMLVFEATKRFPVEERYSMTDQFRRSSRSVAANVSEAWRKRRYPAAFVSKLSDAETEAAETQTWIELARRCGYLAPKIADDMDQRFEEILGQIVRMIERPSDWTIGKRSDGKS
jgi:four helix bundle protein